MLQSKYKIIKAFAAETGILQFYQFNQNQFIGGTLILQIRNQLQL